MLKVLIPSVAILLLAACAADRPSSAAGADLMPPEIVLESGVLEAKPGYTGSKLGVEVEGVSAAGNDLAIDLNLPVAVEQVDRIEVESITGRVIELPREVEIEPGPDPRNTGVRIYLPKSKQWEFRIKIIDMPENE